MVYQILRSSEQELWFATSIAARRGRGVLYALAPLVLFVLALSLLFAASVENLSYYPQLKQLASIGLVLVPALSALAFLLGRRVHAQIEVTIQGLVIRRRDSIGREKLIALARSELAGLAVEPHLRSLGADVLLVALRHNGERVPVAEGEPHAGQVRDLARRISTILNVPLHHR